MTKYPVSFYICFPFFYTHIFVKKKNDTPTEFFCFSKTKPDLQGVPSDNKRKGSSETLRDLI